MAQLLGNGRRRALVIGATGGIGGEVAKSLIARGWAVRALSRNLDAAKRQTAWIGEVEWIAGDAMTEADVIGAAQGTSLIFHGANPPKYRDWRGLAIPMLKASTAAARSSGARLVFPRKHLQFRAGRLADPERDLAAESVLAQRRRACRDGRPLALRRR
jgi:hypothetical protein